MGKDDYTVVIKGKPQGPYNLKDLRDLNLTAETFVRKPGMDDYKQAHEILELRELFGFSHQKTAPQYFAGFDVRLLASFIDHFIIFGIFAITILTSYIFIEEASKRLMAFLVPLPFIVVVKLLYGSIVEAGTHQATVGKRLLDIKVTDVHGNKISLYKSLARNFYKTLSFLPLCFGYFYSFLNKRKQCWHDLLAESLVIKDRIL